MVTPEPDSQTLTSKAYTLYDETTGQGSIIVQNLPQLEAGSNYHLWLNDPRSDNPIPVGWLPNDLENGSGRVFFELETGFAPSGYALTVEDFDPDAGVSSPSDSVILHGP